MQLFNNDIRTKCEDILASLQEISRRTRDREIFYFLNEIQDKLVEIEYTSDEWFTAINLDNDTADRLRTRIKSLSTALDDYDDEIDDMDSGTPQNRLNTKTPKRSK
jgi:hypothetical protein